MSILLFALALLAAVVIVYQLVMIARDLRADADNKEQHERQFRLLDK